MLTLRLSDAFRPSSQNVQNKQTQQQLYDNGLSHWIVGNSEAELLVGDLKFHVRVEVEVYGLALRQEDDEIAVVSEVGCAEYKGWTAENGVS